MQLEWWEKAREVYDFHVAKLIELGTASYGCKKDGWSIRDTAKHFGYPPRSVWIYIRIGHKLGENRDWKNEKLSSLLQEVQDDEEAKRLSLEKSKKKSKA